MDLHKKNKGFSLIELIIVIAIMVVLVGVLAPALFSHVKKSRNTVCMADIDTLQREYALAVAHEQPKDIEEARELLKKIMLQHGGKAEGGGAGASYDGVFSGICNGHGKYQCNLHPANFQTVSIMCDKHGMISFGVEDLRTVLETITLEAGPYQNIEQYFSKGNNTIDSEAISTGSSYGEYGSLAKIIEANMKEQGININGRSWRLYKNKDNYALTLAEKKITLDDVGNYVYCEKYDIVNNVIQKGYVKVTKKQQGDHAVYPVFDGAAFTTELPKK